MIFPEGTSSDGNRVLPFKSALLSAAELALGEDADGRARHAPVQPVSVAYVGLARHADGPGEPAVLRLVWRHGAGPASVGGRWQTGPIDVVVEFHPPLTIDQAGGRKELAAAAEAAVRGGRRQGALGRQFGRRRAASR